LRYVEEYVYITDSVHRLSLLSVHPGANWRCWTVSICRLFSKLCIAIWFKLSPSIALAVLYLMSKICQWAILVNPKKVGCLFRVIANISRSVWNFRLLFSSLSWLDGAYIGLIVAKKLGLSLKISASYSARTFS